MNRIQKLLSSKNTKLLSIYFTAGFPELKNTADICRALEEAGADLIEVGIPFSDPVADGETIQKSNQRALENGMTLNILFEQLAVARKSCKLPIILMGYFNPVMQYGLDRFCQKCKELEIDGTIIPDLPIDLYLEKYKAVFEENDLSNIFLITPQTGDQRIKYVDENSNSFIYAVSSAAVTGGAIQMDDRKAYLQHLLSLKLKNPLLVGFGVSNNGDFEEICKYANGAIIGSAFIRALSTGASGDIEKTVSDFIRAIR